MPQSVTVPETHRSALIAWLRSLTGKSNSVRLTWQTPGHVTLTHRDYDIVGATIQLPVVIDGAMMTITTRSFTKVKPWARGVNVWESRVAFITFLLAWTSGTNHFGM